VLCSHPHYVYRGAFCKVLDTIICKVLDTIIKQVQTGQGTPPCLATSPLDACFKFSMIFWHLGP